MSETIEELTMRLEMATNLYEALGMQNTAGLSTFDRIQANMEYREALQAKYELEKELTKRLAQDETK